MAQYRQKSDGSWESIAGLGSGNRVFHQDAEPTGAVAGDLWCISGLSCPYAIGETKVQYTATDNPNTLYPGTTWDDITSVIDGRYVQFDKTNAVATLKAESLPKPYILNSEAHKHDIQCLWQQGEPQTTGSGYNIFGKSTAAAWGQTSDSGVHSHGVGNLPYQDGAAVRPLTYTVRLWKRSA